MTWLRFHVPPLSFGASERTMGAPPPTSTFLSFPSAKNPTYRLSGDQNGWFAPSVPGSALAGSVASGCTHNIAGPGRAEAKTTTCRPSGEMANCAGLTSVEFSAAAIVNCTGSTGVDLSRKWTTARAPAATVIAPRTAAVLQANHSRD